MNSLENFGHLGILLEADPGGNGIAYVGGADVGRACGAVVSGCPFF